MSTTSKDSADFDHASKEMERQVAKIRSELDQHNDMNAKFFVSVTERMNLLFAQLQMANVEYKSVIDANDILKGAVAQLQEELKGSKANCNDLTAQLEASRAEVHDLKLKLEEGNAKQKQLGIDNNNLSIKLVATEKSRDALEATNSEATRKIAELTDNLIACKIEVAKLSTESEIEHKKVNDLMHAQAQATTAAPEEPKKRKSLLSGLESVSDTWKHMTSDSERGPKEKEKPKRDESSADVSSFFGGKSGGAGKGPR